MNQKLTTIDTRPESKSKPSESEASPTPTSLKKRRIRRQIDLGQVTGSGPSFLLSHEDAGALQSLRQSVQDQLNARAPIELVVAEMATASAWLGLRALRHLGASVDTEVAEQADAVDREYEEIDTTSRTALIYHNAGTARILRGFERSAHESHHTLMHIFPLKSGKTRV